MTGEGFRRVHPSALPVTGAWRPGDPVGRRRFLPLPPDRPFALEGGGLLRGVTVAYETWGDAGARRPTTPCSCATPSPATATPPAGSAPGHPTAGLVGRASIGPGRAIDTDR